MDKILHTGWVKWLAGLSMMLAFSVGIYFGIRVVAAVESGGLEILNSNVPNSYEQSRHCAGDLAEQIRSAVYTELQAQKYKGDYKNKSETAMTVTDYALWIGAEPQTQNNGLSEAEGTTETDGTVATESMPEGEATTAAESMPDDTVTSEAAATTENAVATETATTTESAVATEAATTTESAVATEAEVTTEGAAVPESGDTQQMNETQQMETYTYEYLLSLRNTNNVTDASGLGDDFFYDQDADEKKSDKYVRANRDDLIKQVIAHAENKYLLNEEGDVFGSEEDWDDGSESINPTKTLYQYETVIGEDNWSYNEVTKELYCSRFGQVKQNASIFFHETDLEKYADGLLAEGQQDAGMALLAAPMCYLDGLIEYYTRNLVLHKEQMEMLEYVSEDYVNYRYRIELQDGTIWTNVKETNDITEGASVLWSYDYDSGEISGNLTEDNKAYFYDVLMTSDYRVVDYDGDHVSVGSYLQENAKRVSAALAENMVHKDVMKSSKAVYEDYSYLHQNARKYMFYTMIMGILGLLLFVYLLLVVGYQDRKGTLAKASLSFRIPTEILLLLVFFLCLTLYVIANENYRFMIRAVGGELNFISVIGIGMLWSILPIGFEMLSRLRHREFLARSICFRGIRYIFGRPVRWFTGKFGKMKDSMTDVVQAIRVDARLCAMFAASQAGLAFVLLLSIGFFANGTGAVGLFFLFLAIVVELLVCLIVFRDIRYTAEIIQGVEELKSGNLDYQIPTEHMKGHKKELAENINHLQNGLKLAVEQSIKDERLKTELITNVSHDIKTPLTSIINYVDLLKKEPTTDETAMHYLEVLDQKSQRLKQLMEDLVEVSKSATGNVDFTPMRLDLIEMLRQILGEFEDKFVSRNLEVIENFKLEVAVVNLDSRHTYRVFENLCQNIFKYAMENSRVYVDVFCEKNRVNVVMKNISQYALNISADELMERFVRGDASRNTSGSGLGLSITRNLVTLQQGEFMITLDGDLFKATVIFPLADDNNIENVTGEDGMAENGHA